MTSTFNLGKQRSAKPGGAGAAGMAFDDDSLSSLCRKAFVPAGDWPDKDQLLDIIYWIRQVLCGILGIVWGCLAFYGFLGLGAFLIVSTGLIHLYVTAFQQVDEDLLGGFWDVAKEGFMSSFATFLVCWIIAYSALYF